MRQRSVIARSRLVEENPLEATDSPWAPTTALSIVECILRSISKCDVCHAHSLFTKRVFPVVELYDTGGYPLSSVLDRHRWVLADLPPQIFPPPDQMIHAIRREQFDPIVAIVRVVPKLATLADRRLLRLSELVEPLLRNVHDAMRISRAAALYAICTLCASVCTRDQVVGSAHSVLHYQRLMRS